MDSLASRPLDRQGENYRQGESYCYDGAGLNSSHTYLVPAVLGVLSEIFPPDTPRRLFDLGCGNGSVAAELSARGYDVTGVDPSSQAIAMARAHYPHLNLHQMSAYDDLSATFGRFPAVLSMEVIEHLYHPRRLLRAAFDLLEPAGGTLVLTTPYHGYVKNLALAITGRLDAHFDALTDDGHIKFFSVPTLRRLALEAGFAAPKFRLVGRIPPLAKSMLMTAVRLPEA